MCLICLSSQRDSISDWISDPGLRAFSCLKESTQLGLQQGSLLRNHRSRFVCCIFVIAIDVAVHGGSELVVSPVEWIQCLLGVYFMENRFAHGHFLPLLLHNLELTFHFWIPTMSEPNKFMVILHEYHITMICNEVRVKMQAGESNVQEPFQGHAWRGRWCSCYYNVQSALWTWTTQRDRMPHW